MGRVQSFLLILGRVVLGHFSCGSGRVKEIGPTSNSGLARRPILKLPEQFDQKKLQVVT